MAFNITSFLGGMAKGGSRVLEERRDQSRRDKETAEQRQWTIATEARQDARTRKADRLSKKQELEDLVTEASLYFDSEDIPTISSNGKVGLLAAIERAKELSAYGIRGGDLMKLQGVSGPDDFPTKEDVTSTTKRKGNFMDKLTSIPKEPEVYTGGTYEGMDIFFREKLRTARTTEEKDMYTKKLVEVAGLVEKKKGTNNQDTIKFANDTIQNLIDKSFDTKGLMQKDPTGNYIQRMKSTEPEGFRLIGNALAAVRSNGVVKDSTMDNVLKFREAENNRSINSYVANAANTYTKFDAEKSKLATMPSSNSTERKLRREQEDKVNALQSTAGNFVPLDANSPVTPADVASIAANYDTNTVIQVQLEDGTIGYALKAETGIIKLGFE